MLLQGKVNSAHYIAQVINPALLAFLRQEGEVPFQQENPHSHTAAATQLVLCDVQQLPWLVRSQDLSPIEYVLGMIKREFTPEPATTIDECTVVEQVVAYALVTQRARVRSRSGQVSWVRIFGVYPHLLDEYQEALGPQGPQI